MITMLDGVCVKDIHSKLWDAIYIIERVYKDEYGTDLVITAGSEWTKQHSIKSLHPVGLAVDIRIKNLPPMIDKEDVRNTLQQAVGNMYDIILHSSHIHCEYDPRKIAYVVSSNI